VCDWLLSPHVRICTLADAAVLLDLRADRYYGLPQRQSAALSLVVRGWPSLAQDESLPCDPWHAEALAHELAGRGLLTQDGSRGRSAVPVVLPRIEEQLHVWDRADWSAIRAAHCCAFAIAWARATLELRLRRFAQIVASVERRKAGRMEGSSFDQVKARLLMHVFRALRPLFYTTIDRCLLDSLVLIEFLALYGQFPTWVIGVRTGPFAAHSWVQHDQYVLNGAPTFVRAFTPILAV
jgi:hypothetical protein